MRIGSHQNKLHRSLTAVASGISLALFVGLIVYVTTTSNAFTSSNQFGVNAAFVPQQYQHQQQFSSQHMRNPYHYQQQQQQQQAPGATPLKYSHLYNQHHSNLQQQQHQHQVDSQFGSSDPAAGAQQFMASIIQYLPEYKLQKLHETTCFLESIHELERESVLAATPAMQWRKQQALDELAFVLSQPDPMQDRLSGFGPDDNLIITEEILKRVELGSLFFHFERTMLAGVGGATEPEDGSAMTGPTTPVTPAEGGILKSAPPTSPTPTSTSRSPLETRAQAQRQRATQKVGRQSFKEANLMHSTKMTHFPRNKLDIDFVLEDGTAEKFVNLRFLEGFIIFNLAANIVASLFIIPAVNLGYIKNAAKTLKMVLFAFTAATLICGKVVNVAGLGEFNSFTSALTFLYSYIFLTALIRTGSHHRNVREWQDWFQENLTFFLHYCSVVWSSTALLYQSDMMAFFAITALTATLICSDLGYTYDRLSVALHSTLRFQDAVLAALHFRSADSHQAALQKRSRAPFLISSSLHLTLMYLILASLRWATALMHCLRVFERGLLFYGSTLYFVTWLVVSSKWYWSHRVLFPEKDLVRDPYTRTEAPLRQRYGGTEEKAVPDFNILGGGGARASALLRKSHNKIKNTMMMSGGESTTNTADNTAANADVTTTTTSTRRYRTHPRPLRKRVAEEEEEEIRHLQEQQQAEAEEEAFIEEEEEEVQAQKNHQPASSPPPPVAAVDDSTITGSSSNMPGRRKQWHALYMQATVIAIASGTLSFLFGSFFKNAGGGMLHTITGYFFIAMLYLKYIEIFWKRKNVLWAALGMCGVVYITLVMIRSFPALFNPVQYLIDQAVIPVSMAYRIQPQAAATAAAGHAY